VCVFVVVCILFLFFLCVFCVYVFVQVCCSVVCILVFLGFLVLCNFSWFWDTRQWIKSINTLRLMLIHHRQKPTDVIY
jgi:hypothetical protein